MKKSDLINALSVMNTILKAAKLENKPAEAMIYELERNNIYFETDLERAFIAGWLCNYKTLNDIKNFDFESSFNTFKANYIKN